MIQDKYRELILTPDTLRVEKTLDELKNEYPINIDFIKHRTVSAEGHSPFRSVDIRQYSKVPQDVRKAFRIDDGFDMNIVQNSNPYIYEGVEDDPRLKQKVQGFTEAEREDDRNRVAVITKSKGKDTLPRSVVELVKQGYEPGSDELYPFFGYVKSDIHKVGGLSVNGISNVRGIVSDEELKNA